MELELVYNEETQEWEQKPEPFITIECETEEDFEFIGTAVAFYKKHFEKQEKPQTNADRIRAMSDEELADFFFESTEIEFTVCEYCEYFGGHTSDTPCKHDMGRCLIPAKNEAFKKWLKQPAEDDHG